MKSTLKTDRDRLMADGQHHLATMENTLQTDGQRQTDRQTETD